ncbi:MAG: hypothetical protein MUC60_00550 [Oscillatoria sp. Prado101]|jgi:hypothetical protein|nr:hypothetical protein [Oscillatoria sp. Prado101]
MLEKLLHATTITFLLYMSVNVSSPSTHTPSTWQPLKALQVIAGYDHK